MINQKVNNMRKNRLHRGILGGNSMYVWLLFFIVNIIFVECGIFEAEDSSMQKKRSNVNGESIAQRVKMRRLEQMINNILIKVLLCKYLFLFLLKVYVVCCYHVRSIKTCGIVMCGLLTSRPSSSQPNLRKQARRARSARLVVSSSEQFFP
jgi:hypothetical protein